MRFKMSWWQILAAAITLGIAVWATITRNAEVAWIFWILSVMWFYPAFSAIAHPKNDD